MIRNPIQFVGLAGVFMLAAHVAGGSQGDVPLPNYKQQRTHSDNKEYVQRLRQDLLRLHAQREYYRAHAGREPSEKVRTRMEETLTSWHGAMFGKGGDHPRPILDDNWPRRLGEFYSMAAEVLGKEGPKTTVDLSKYRHTELRQQHGWPIRAACAG